ncbi:MAG: aldo/keto reductase [Acholeplasmatales bacterium]|jgi:predicted aldo/keto reductase-like oxidoreductase|nr:aldo/keto reductase [Acholeplasmatales bacterium]
MEKREFKKLKTKPSLLGFGCMRFPTLEDGEIDKEQVRIMFSEAFKGGVTYFDTAYPYHGGQSELVVGEILKDYARDSFTITTKLPVWKVFKEEDILKIFNEQLTKLQMDYVDFYLIHAIDKVKYDHIKSLGVFEKMVALKKQGKIKHLGFSFHGVLEDFIYILEDGKKYWDIVQIQLNYMDLDHQQGITGYNLLEKYDIPVIIMEPVKGGSLSKLPSNISLPLFLKHPTWSISSWAFRFLFQFKNIVTILSGMSNLYQVEDNIKTFNSEDRYDTEDYEIIAKVRENLEKRIFVPCTGCKYCMPCPAGVDIKNIFARYNEMYIYDRCTDFDLEVLIEDSYLESCVKCGVCLSKCPQSIKIPSKLEEIKKNINK